MVSKKSHLMVDWGSTVDSWRENDWVWMAAKVNDWAWNAPLHHVHLRHLRHRGRRPREDLSP